MELKRKMIDPSSVVSNYDTLTDCEKCGHKDIHHIGLRDVPIADFSCMHCYCSKHSVSEQLSLIPNEVICL